MLEIEKRSLLKNEEEFNKVKGYLDKNGKFLGKKILKSFLFLKPAHLRIRLVKGSEEVIITKKIGDFIDSARQENEKEIPLSHLPSFLEKIQKEGFGECSEFNTERYIYELDGLRVELNKIDLLGLIAEVEALTEDKNQIPEYEDKIRKIMKKLSIKELKPQKYKELINKEWKKASKKISEQSFKFKD